MSFARYNSDMASPLSYGRPEVPVNRDDGYYLNVLGICHYLLGGMFAFGAVVGLAVQGGLNGGSLILLALGGLAISSGIGLRLRRLWVLSILVSAGTCLMFPLGTLLGVLTIATLCRRSVQVLYRAAAQASNAGRPQPVLPA